MFLAGLPVCRRCAGRGTRGAAGGWGWRDGSPPSGAAGGADAGAGARAGTGERCGACRRGWHLRGKGYGGQDNSPGWSRRAGSWDQAATGPGGQLAVMGPQRCAASSGEAPPGGCGERCVAGHGARPVGSGSPAARNGCGPVCGPSVMPARGTVDRAPPSAPPGFASRHTPSHRRRSARGLPSTVAPALVHRSTIPSGGDVPGCVQCISSTSICRSH